MGCVKNDEQRRNWKASSLSKLILKANETGSRDRAKILTLSFDVHNFIKHAMNDVIKNI